MHFIIHGGRALLILLFEIYDYIIEPCRNEIITFTLSVTHLNQIILLLKHVGKLH